MRNLGTDQYAYGNLLYNKNQHLESVQENKLFNNCFGDQL